jgi:hypothetical protein
MKKIAMLLSVFVFALVVFSGCGKDKEDKKNDNKLPTGWYSLCKTNPPSVDFNNLHVGDSIMFYIEVYDDNNEIVTDYDTSSTIWSIEPADAGTLSDIVGSATTFTATKAGTFVRKYHFKDIIGTQNITIQP